MTPCASRSDATFGACLNIYSVDYWKYTFNTDPDSRDILLALLSEGPFDTFEETENGLDAYMPALAEHPDALLAALADQWTFSWSRTLIPGQNWNALWESNFQPVQVGRFCGVRAQFHPPFTDVEHELVIHPKMAFGTGHHETTWLCLATLEHLQVEGAHVLDYGCGTGILAILAARLGASHVEAVDIEEESYQNTLENASINGVAERITARCGTLEAVQTGPFDCILANINRNVILDSLPALSALLRPGGRILASGFLEADEPVLRHAVEENHLRWVSHEQRGRWLAAVWEQMPTEGKKQG
ncbi:MAG: 50S ribosomal protein L11 methyltransferase [Saprospiraceae bacterium]|nr:50S ribosomal protein L11 methyltransferase [Saprospiraceae bacterium]